MTALLTDNLPLLAGAPNGIKKLRELILELAVRGKLLPQDPNDEPASELLKKISEEKARLVAEGKIKKQKPLSERDAEDSAFELPAGWAWARLADVVNVLNGRAYKKEELLDAGTPVLRVGNLFTSNHWYYSTLTLEEDKYCNPGDLLFAWSASFGPFIWQGERSIYHYHIWKLDFYAKGQLSKHYLYNYLLEQTQEIKAAGHGVSMVHMTKEKMEKLVVPVPPLAEQHRIVAKVDELMALCDRLEAQQADAESAHVQLVQALLDSLTQASDATDFAANWQRLAEHFHSLFTTEPSIEALKQTLLQLAVMGKLVPQDPSDEPVSDLYKQITIWKEKLVNGKVYQKTAALKPRANKYTYPSSWLKVQIGDICPSIVPVRDKPKSFSGSTPWVTLSSFPESNWFLDDSKPELGLSSYEISKYGVRTIPEGSVMMSCIGRFGLAAINRVPVVTNQQIHSFVVHKDIAPEFLIFVIKVASKYLEDLATSTTIAYLNKSNCESIELGLPPAKEQHRIVAKVDQLMALCDQLKTRLTQARQLNEQLASTLVEQAVA